MAGVAAVAGAPGPVAGMAATIARLDTRTGAPHVLVAKTTFGKGVSFMERQIKWHYWPMSDDEYRQAIECFQRYLELSPYAEDQARVREQITWIEAWLDQN